MTSQVVNTFALKPDQVAELMASLGIDADQRDVFAMKFTDVEWNQGKSIREAVKYLGFDAKMIVAQFFKKAAENPIGPGDLPTLEIGETKIYEKCDPRTDLLFFLNIFLERGNNVTKALLKCSPSAGAALKRKASAYGIVMDPVQNRTVLGSKELTLARLAQAFSVQTATIIVKDKIIGKLKSKLFRGTMPLIMQHTIFSGLIPTASDVTDDLREIALYLNVEMSITLASPKDKRKMAVRTLEELIEPSAQYVDAAMNGSMISDPIRIRMLTKAGVLALNGDMITLSDEVKIMVNDLNVIRGNNRQPYQAAVTAVNSTRDVTAAGPSVSVN